MIVEEMPSWAGAPYTQPRWRKWQRWVMRRMFRLETAFGNQGGSEKSRLKADFLGSFGPKSTGEHMAECDTLPYAPSEQNVFPCSENSITEMLTTNKYKKVYHVKAIISTQKFRTLLTGSSSDIIFRSWRKRHSSGT